MHGKNMDQIELGITIVGRKEVVCWSNRLKRLRCRPLIGGFVHTTCGYPRHIRLTVTTGGESADNRHLTCGM